MSAMLTPYSSGADPSSLRGESTIRSPFVTRLPCQEEDTHDGMVRTLSLSYDKTRLSFPEPVPAQRRIRLTGYLYYLLQALLNWTGLGYVQWAGPIAIIMFAAWLIHRRHEAR